MPGAGQEVRTIPSILDRLLDDAPDAMREVPLDWYQQIRRLKESVARDLESLLNTRQEVTPEALGGRNDLIRSLLTYGLPDFSSLIVTSPKDYERVSRAVAKAIKDFEPRLAGVTVTLEPPRDVDGGLRFHIDATLLIEPTPEEVTFDAVLQPSTQEYKVEGGS